MSEVLMDGFGVPSYVLVQQRAWDKRFRLLQLRKAGYTVSELAGILGYSQSTVRSMLEMAKYQKALRKRPPVTRWLEQQEYLERVKIPREMAKLSRPNIPHTMAALSKLANPKTPARDWLIV